MVNKRRPPFLLFLVFLLSAHPLLAQLSEPDLGYQDTRKKREGFARLQPKTVRDEVATFALGGISESVGTTPLPKITYIDFGNDYMIFEGEGLRGTVKIAPFSPDGHRLDYDEKYLIKIDKKPYYGDYGTVPRTYIKEVTLTVDGDTVSIPPAAYSDLYNLHLTYISQGAQRTTNAIYRTRDGKRIYFYLFSKDDTGSYEVTWIFEDKKFVRRVLDYGIM